MDMAIEKTMEMLGDQLDDTLIIVTADHAHSMTISGYSDRGSDIRGSIKIMLFALKIYFSFTSLFFRT